MCVCIFVCEQLSIKVSPEKLNFLQGNSRPADVVSAGSSPAAWPVHEAAAAAGSPGASAPPPAAGGCTPAKDQP